MNVGKLYAEATGRTEQPLDAGPSFGEQQILQQQKFEWLNHPVTKQFFKDIGEQISVLENTARNLAMAGTNSHQLTVSLVRSTELRTLIEKYGNSSN